jgi:DNA-binding MarR family transcriptional regulator
MASTSNRNGDQPAADGGEAGTAPCAPDVRLLLHRKVLAAQRHRAAVARRLEMSESEVAALAYLAQGGLTPGQLGERLQLTSGGVTALLHRLERGGRVTRRPHPRDKRSVVLSVNADVLEKVAECYAPLAAEQDELTRSLSETELALVCGYLERIVAMSERHVEEMISRLDQDATEAIDEDATHLWA